MFRYSEHGTNSCEQNILSGPFVVNFSWVFTGNCSIVGWANTDFFQILTCSSLVILFPSYPLLYNLCSWKSILSDRINYLRTLCFLLDVLAKLQTVTTVSFVMCIRPYGTTGLTLDGFSWELKFKIYGKSDKKIQVWLKCNKNNGYFRWQCM